eukprot:CCRYP_000217-RA/>CCRYP_000217-RA protein AED:0.36 eAED:0.36 QI:0/-1/0/1/-1/1/1/0/110
MTYERVTHHGSLALYLTSMISLGASSTGINFILADRSFPPGKSTISSNAFLSSAMRVRVVACSMRVRWDDVGTKAEESGRMTRRETRHAAVLLRVGIVFALGVNGDDDDS